MEALHPNSRGVARASTKMGLGGKGCLAGVSKEPGHGCTKSHGSAHTDRVTGDRVTGRPRDRDTRAEVVTAP